jgi:hypothetical protein
MLHFPNAPGEHKMQQMPFGRSGTPKPSLIPMQEMSCTQKNHKTQHQNQWLFDRKFLKPAPARN